MAYSKRREEVPPDEPCPVIASTGEVEPPTPPTQPPTTSITLEEKKYQPKTKLFPPEASTVSANSQLFIIETETGEGFVDFLYVNVSDPTEMFLIVELDGVEWLNLSPYDIRNAAAGLGIDGWFGYLGSQIYSDDEDAYGISLVPTKDTAPFYETLRVWVYNVSDSEQTLRKAIVGWRKRIK